MLYKKKWDMNNSDSDFKCESTSHQPYNCLAFNKTYDKCQKKGHFATQCFSKQNSKPSKNTAKEKSKKESMH